MKAIILAGGRGIRLSEITESTPKPLVEINQIPIIEHVIRHLNKYGFKDFYLLLGYKANLIKKYFLDYKILKTNFSIDYKSNKIQKLNKVDINFKINLIETGLNSNTGGRLSYLKDILNKNEEFFLTYCDAITDLNIKEFLKAHKKNKIQNSLVLSRLTARFGKMRLNEKNFLVKEFFEKNPDLENFVNAGYYILNSNIIKLIDNLDCNFENEILPVLAKNNNLSFFKHYGFWQPMDNIRDKQLLENYFKNELL